MRVAKKEKAKFCEDLRLVVWSWFLSWFLVLTFSYVGGDAGWMILRISKGLYINPLGFSMKPRVNSRGRGSTLRHMLKWASLKHCSSWLAAKWAVLLNVLVWVVWLVWFRLTVILGELVFWNKIPVIDHSKWLPLAVCRWYVLSVRTTPYSFACNNPLSIDTIKRGIYFRHRWLFFIATIFSDPTFFLIV